MDDFYKIDSWDTEDAEEFHSWKQRARIQEAMSDINQGGDAVMRETIAEARMFATTTWDETTSKLSPDQTEALQDTLVKRVLQFIGESNPWVEQTST